MPFGLKPGTTVFLFPRCQSLAVSCLRRRLRGRSREGRSRTPPRTTEAGRRDNSVDAEVQDAEAKEKSKLREEISREFEAEQQDSTRTLEKELYIANAKLKEIQEKEA